jgi:hypothetical protein
MLLGHFLFSKILFILYKKTIMKKTYQPEVIQHTENLIEGLKDSNFFEDYEIIDLTYTRQYLNELFTGKFIEGKLGEDIDGIFSEKEFEIMLREIAAGTVLFELKKSGLVDSYEDDTTEEMFFLTEKGKQFLKDPEV